MTITNTYTKEELLRLLQKNRAEGPEPLHLEQPVFSQQDFSRENLQGLDAPHSNWFGCKCTETHIGGDRLPQSEMVGLDLTRAILKGANLDHAKFHDCSLREANCQHISAKQAEFLQVDAHNADFTGANLSMCQFLGESSFRGATFTGANLDHAKMQQVDLYWTNLRFSSLEYANLGGAQLDGTDLSYANLAFTDLRDASLQGADLTWAHLDCTLFSSVEQLEQTDLHTIQNAFHAVLRRQSFEQVEDYLHYLQEGYPKPIKLFFNLYPDSDDAVQVRTLDQQSQQDIIVQRFDNQQLKLARGSHPVSLLFIKWVVAWLVERRMRDE